MTRAVERLNIDWPAERVRSKSRLDECFSPSRAQPQCRRLPHRGVEIMGENGFLLSSYRVLKKRKGYREMPKVEETLASYLSPESSSSARPCITHLSSENYFSTGGKGLFSGWSGCSMFTHYVTVVSLPG